MRRYTNTLMGKEQWNTPYYITHGVLAEGEHIPVRTNMEYPKEVVPKGLWSKDELLLTLWIAHSM
jgi:hypothetical protein